MVGKRACIYVLLHRTVEGNKDKKEEEEEVAATGDGVCHGPVVPVAPVGVPVARRGARSARRRARSARSPRSPCP